MRLVRSYAIPQHYGATRNRAPDKAYRRRQGPDHPPPNEITETAPLRETAWGNPKASTQLPTTLSGLAHATLNTGKSHSNQRDILTTPDPVRHHWRWLVRRYAIPQHYGATRNRAPDKAYRRRQGPYHPPPNEITETAPLRETAWGNQLKKQSKGPPSHHRIGLYWMFYDHFSAHSLLAKLGRWWWWWGWGWLERKARRH